MKVPSDPTYFFMHIMKTAGTTFAQHVKANFPPEQIHPHPDVGAEHATQYWQIKELRNLSPQRRAEIRMYSGHFPYAVGDLVGADVIFTILRDPIDRTMSALRHCERRFPQHRGKPLEAIYEDDWHHPTLLLNYQVKQFAMTSDDPLRGHIDVINMDEDRFKVAVANLEAVDLLGLTDRFGEFTDAVAQRFGWTIDPVLNLQVSPPDDRDERALRQRIAADSAADLAFYEHAKSLYSRRGGPG